MMRRTSSHSALISTLLFMILFSYSSFSEATESHFSTQYHRLVARHLPHASVGCIVQDPRTGHILFEHNAKQYFHPASNTKILIAMAALLSLGPDFQYHTTLRATLPSLPDPVLKTDVYLVFQGDPSFTTVDLYQLLNQLKKHGIHTLEGNIIIDDRAFSGPAYAPGWTWDSLPWAYSAPSTAIVLNENKVPVYFSRTDALQAPINISAPLPLQAQVTSVSLDAEKHCQLQASVHNNHLSLHGCWPRDNTPITLQLAIDNPRQQLVHYVKGYLQQQGVRFTGEILFQQAPSAVPIIATKRSFPLLTLLTQVMAESNNLYAENLTKTLGLHYQGIGSFQQGIRAIRAIIQDATHIDLTPFPLSDGSGQSRYNLLSPFVLAQLLSAMYQHPTFELFQSTFSINGKKGSLSTRMKEEPFIGKIIAKTGTATGTSALSGYVTARNGKQYVFSIMINQANQRYPALKAFEDQLCQLLIKDSN